MESEAETGERLDSLEAWQKDLERRFAEAFPGGDHVGHCRYHQLMIEDIDAKKRLREAIVQKTIAGLVWGAMIGLGIAVWQYIKSLLGR
jgi:hypothetical protein